ncbi:MAG: membrane protein insertion efficiency factor YidD [Pseudomonadota bacterium]
MPDQGLRVQSGIRTVAGFRSRLATILLNTYKYTLSPVFAVFGAQCRHHPSCSEYAAECLRRHGFWPALWMAMARLSRCRPGGTMGNDPAPDVKPDVPFWAPWRYGDWSGPPRVED